eukprot:PLAT14644.1.p1 GENE.PLAT14644.1~~PLAT14644.1.p1  ORF type:complete len:591 (-),score=174.86 PLAT14644.1:588-2234(-)
MEVLLLHVGGLYLATELASEAVRLQLVVQLLQIDNPCATDPHAVVLAAASSASRSKRDSQQPPPVLDVTASAFLSESPLIHVSRLAVALQPLEVNVDEILLLRLLRVVEMILPAHADSADAGEWPHAAEESGEDGAKRPSSPSGRAAPDVEGKQEEKEEEEGADVLRAERSVYVDKLDIEDIELRLTFAKGATTMHRGLRSGMGMLNLLQTFGSQLANISDIPLHFPALHICHGQATVNSWTGRLSWHYARAFLSQVYKVLLSSDLLGNPASLVFGIGSSLKVMGSDLLRSGKEGSVVALGKGLIHGSSDVVRAVGGGVAKSLSTVTGRLGDMARGVGRSVAFAQLLASPVADVLGSTASMMKQAAGVLSRVDEARLIRLPRLLPADGSVQPYDARAAHGQQLAKRLLARINMPSLLSPYVAHAFMMRDYELQQGEDTAVLLLLTVRHIFCATQSATQLLWALPLSAAPQAQWEQLEQRRPWLVISAGDRAEMLLATDDAEQGAARRLKMLLQLAAASGGCRLPWHRTLAAIRPPRSHLLHALTWGAL